MSNELILLEAKSFAENKIKSLKDDPDQSAKEMIKIYEVYRKLIEVELEKISKEIK